MQKINIQLLNKQINNLMEEIFSLYEKNDYEKVCIIAEEAEKLFDNYLIDNPQDTEHWIKLALLVYWPPLADYIKAMECVKKVLSYDPQNVYAAVLLATFKYYNTFIDDECFHTLSLIHTNDNEFKAMIELSKARYFMHENKKKRAECLNKGIDYWKAHVKEFLSHYSCNDFSQSLSKRVRANLQVICDNYPAESYDRLNVEQFINEFIRVPLHRYK